MHRLLRLLSLLSLLLVLLDACTAAAPGLRPVAMPNEASQRRSSLSELAERLFAGLQAGSMDRCVASPNELDQLLDPEARMHAERERHAHGGFASSTLFPKDWGGGRFAGFCAQGARNEPAHAALGLRQRGWVLERILVVASLGATRSAAWVSGRFVYTDAGWKLLSVDQIEQPRRQHSDLDLAPCDVEAGLR